jgi:alkylation response protein AidB-like acyl-CoA dehydrogenase
MQFAFTEEQILIRDTAREFFNEHATSARVRAALVAPGGYEQALWSELLAMGWAGIAVPEAYGGSGLGWVELCLLQAEQGRRLVPSPFFSTAALAAPLWMQVATAAQQAEWLPALVSGTHQFACAVTGVGGQPGASGVTAILTPRAAGGYRLTGAANYVIHGQTADSLLVVARAPGSAGDAGLSVVRLPADAAGVTRTAQVMLDLTRPMSRVEFHTVDLSAEQVLGTAEAAGPALDTVLQLARIALAAECVGGAEYVLEMTTDYARQRVQFGRPIGSFQAVKHRLADMMVAVEAAKSAAWYAACVAAESPAELPEAAAIAKSNCSDAFFNCAANGIQLHGGIGYTWDHDAHLYFKRARAAATLLGSPAWQREQLATWMGLGESAAPPRY